MAPSASRGSRTRPSSQRETAASPAAVETPSRPAKRRRTLSDSDHNNHSNDDDDDDDDDDCNHSGTTTTEAAETEYLITQVVQHLACPKVPVQASQDHSNKLHESSEDGVKAYAKIAALDWTFYITALETNIGRAPDPLLAPTSSPSNAVDTTTKTTVHIDLGPSKTISRQHAVIYFHSQAEQWHLKVKSRNGAKLDGVSIKGGVSTALHSGSVFEIGGVEMMFVLPTAISPLQIHDSFLRRAGLPCSTPKPSSTKASSIKPPKNKGKGKDVAQPPPQETSKVDPMLPALEPKPVSDTAPLKSATGGHTVHQPIAPAPAPAPAPADYRRPNTPPTMSAAPALSTPRIGLPATPMAGAPKIDLSLDENATIKPLFSYAQMITQAILKAPDEKLNLNGIYKYITSTYAYYRHQPAAGWQNSIRHNLSLNKSFDKVARSTDEPGKGMKWQIVPEARDEMVRTAYRGGRGGHRGGSVPSSPSQLNYITQGPRDMAASSRKRRLSPVQPQTPLAAVEIKTPTKIRTTASSSVDDGLAITFSEPRRSILGAESPAGAFIIHNRQTAAPADQHTPKKQRQQQDAPCPMLTTLTQQQQQQQRTPTLPTAAYINDDGVSFVTPAPPRVIPHLAPPSTVQKKPSQHMPTSSPAPFWKYMDMGSTPSRSLLRFDSSPTCQPVVAVAADGGADADADADGPADGPVAASSPPELQDSPTKGRGRPLVSATAAPEDDEAALEPASEDGAQEPEQYDLTRGFQSIGQFHKDGMAAPMLLHHGIKLGQK